MASLFIRIDLRPGGQGGGGAMLTGIGAGLVHHWRAIEAEA
jgi:molybdenum-dependent DNA-binding transcriptional regulator ModE